MFQWPAHIHPMLTHFPIALFITASVFYGMGLACQNERLCYSALQVYIAAVLITPVVVWTGLQEAEQLRLGQHPMVMKHRLYALWTMWLSLTSLPVLFLIKNKYARYFKLSFFVFLVVLVVIVSVTADKGGRLVYEYGVGVE